MIEVLDAARRSVWLDRPRDTAAMRDTLAATNECGLLVVGAGLTGLWAAYEAASEGVDVLVVDSREVAGGATGRCGGFINASITHGIPHGHARWPNDMPTIVRLQEALWDETLSLIADSGEPDIIQPSGKMTVATTHPQLRALPETVGILRKYGQSVTELDRDAVRSVVRSPTYLAGHLHETANGICDPVRLSDAIASLARRAGARIVTGTTISEIDDRRSLDVRTEQGRIIRAEQVLLATNAYRPLRRRLRRRVIPVYDHVIATAPLTPAQRSAIAWEKPYGITDAGNRFHYYRPTPDGRILFGGWDATYHFGSHLDERFEYSLTSHRTLAQHLCETFPQLDGIEISHRWGGPIDVTSRLTPMFGTSADRRIGWAVGFTGLGVGASRFAALIALDLLAGRQSPRTALGVVRRPPIPFPPEPLRWSAVALTARALAREDRTGVRGPWLRILDRLGLGFDT